MYEYYKHVLFVALVGHLDDCSLLALLINPKVELF